jgi:uncharacterized protein (TIGR03437 family)
MQSWCRSNPSCPVAGLSVLNPNSAAQLANPTPNAAENGAESDSTWYDVEPAPAAVLLLSPSSAIAFDGASLLSVRGYGFGSVSLVNVNGAPLPTGFLNSSELTALVPAAMLTAGSTVRVSVLTGGYTTGWLPLTVTGPSVSAGGVVNAASSLPQIAPGSLISIYGTELSTGTYQAGSAPLPTSLSGTTVTIDGVAVPLLFVSPTQINAQAPYETPIGVTALVVTVDNVSSPPVSFVVGGAGPGIYTFGLTDQAVAVNLPEGTINTAMSPAAPGQYITVYLTGQGTVYPAVPTGAAAPADPLSLPVLNTQATIGGVSSLVQFAGLAPGFVGLLQLNLQAPNFVAGQLPLQVAIGGAMSNVVVISVMVP